MKFILSLAAIAAFANAIDLASEAEVETEAAVEVLAETGAEVEAGYDGPIVPEKYGQAVHEFSLE